jgi:glycosyltransferase involved in cell wall biosynthesis
VYTCKQQKSDKEKSQILKKIVFFLPNLERGGYQRVFITLMHLLDKDKYEISLVVTGKEGALRNLIPNGVNFYEFKSRKTLFSLWKSLKLVKRLKPDIVSSTSYMVNLVVILVKLLSGKQNKTRIWLREPNTPGNSITFFHKFLLKRLYNYADCILAQTPEMKEQVLKFYNVDSSKVKVLYNPLDVDYLNNSIKNKSNPFDPEFVNLIAIGRLTKQKNFDWLIRSFQYISGQSKNYRLYILGDGHERSRLEKLIEKERLNNSVFLPGEKENPYIYLKYADLLVSSSLWEGMPNVILESIFLGTPVVAVESTSYLKKLIRDPLNGSVIEEFNTNIMIKRILNYRKYRIDISLLKHHIKKSDWIEEIGN